MKSKKEEKTIRYYDQSAREWVTAYGRDKGESFWKPQMEHFHELLQEGKVLEIGSGGGKDALFLRDLGYEYTGTDASNSLIKIAQMNNPDAKFVHVAVEDLDFKDKFDGFWAAAVLLHIPKENIDKALQAIKDQIRDGGIGFITLKEGDGEKEDINTGRWFSYYREDEFRHVLERNDFKIIESERKKDGREGKPDWLTFFVSV